MVLTSKHRILPLPDTSSRQGAQTVAIVYQPIESRLLEAMVCQHDGLQPLSVLERRGGRMREVHRPCHHSCIRQLCSSQCIADSHE